MDKKRIFTQLSLRTEGTLSAQTAEYFANNGADGLLLEDSYTSDAEHDHNIGSIKQIVRTVDVPVYVYGGIRRLADVKMCIRDRPITAMTLDLKSISSRLAASVPVQAPVPGSGMPTNKSSATNKPLPAEACSFWPPFSPFCIHQVKKPPITGLSEPHSSTFLAKK